MRRFWRFYFLRIILILVGIELIYFAWLQYRNHCPEAVDDIASVNQRHSVKIDLLRNDTDKEEDDTLRIQQVNEPMHGSFIKVGDNAIEYTPENGFIGIDSFTYIINDGKKDSRPGYIKINVDENEAPIAQNDEVIIFPWTKTTLPLLGNDRDNEGDTMFIDGFTDPIYGQINRVGADLIYSLSNKKTKVDSFYYTLSDGVKTSLRATVLIKVKDAKSSIFSSVPFYGDLKNYEQFDPSRWDIMNENGNLVVGINTSSYGNLSGNRTGGYNLIKNRWFTGNMRIQLRIKCTDDLQNNSAADHAVYFAFVDYMNYCYASFSAHEEGDGYTGLFKIVDGQRQAVICKDQAFTDNKYHNFEVIRKGNTVITKVDGRELCRATDEVFNLKGRIGIGSYNDMANFDDIKVTGKFETKQ